MATRKVAMRAVLESACQIGFEDPSKEKFTWHDLQDGMTVEQEHNDGGKLDVTDGLDDVCRIALAHLRENPLYYKKLVPAEKQWAKEAEGKGLLKKSLGGPFAGFEGEPDYKPGRTPGKNKLWILPDGTAKDCKHDDHHDVAGRVMGVHKFDDVSNAKGRLHAAGGVTIDTAEKQAPGVMYKPTGQYHSHIIVGPDLTPESRRAIAKHTSHSSTIMLNASRGSKVHYSGTTVPRHQLNSELDKADESFHGAPLYDMYKALGNAGNDMWYHGTHDDSAQSIRRTGFRASDDGTAGPGVYLVKDPAHATYERNPGLSSSVKAHGGRQPDTVVAARVKGELYDAGTFDAKDGPSVYVRPHQHAALQVGGRDEGLRWFHDAPGVLAEHGYNGVQWRFQDGRHAAVVFNPEHVSAVKDGLGKSLEPALYVDLRKGLPLRKPHNTPSEAHERLLAKYKEATPDEMRRFLGYLTHDGKFVHGSDHDGMARDAMDDRGATDHDFMHHTGAMRAVYFPPARFGHPEDGDTWAVEAHTKPTAAQMTALASHANGSNITYDLVGKHEVNKDGSLGQFQRHAEEVFGGGRTLRKGLEQPFEAKNTPDTARGRLKITYPTTTPGSGERDGFYGWLAHDGGFHEVPDHRDSAQHCMDDPEGTERQFQEHTGAIRAIKTPLNYWALECKKRPTQAQREAIGKHMAGQVLHYDMYNAAKDSNRGWSRDNDPAAYKYRSDSSVGQFMRDADEHYGTDLKKGGGGYVVAWAQKMHEKGATPAQIFKEMHRRDAAAELRPKMRLASQMSGTLGDNGEYRAGRPGREISRGRFGMIKDAQAATGIVNKIGRKFGEGLADHIAKNTQYAAMNKMPGELGQYYRHSGKIKLDSWGGDTDGGVFAHEAGHHFHQLVQAAAASGSTHPDAKWAKKLDDTNERVFKGKAGNRTYNDYEPSKRSGEQFADAFRAYLTDPEHSKSIYPEHHKLFKQRDNEEHNYTLLKGLFEDIFDMGDLAKALNTRPTRVYRGMSSAEYHDWHAKGHVPAGKHTADGSMAGWADDMSKMGKNDIMVSFKAPAGSLRQGDGGKGHWKTAAHIPIDQADVQVESGALKDKATTDAEGGKWKTAKSEIYSHLREGSVLHPGGGSSYRIAKREPHAVHLQQIPRAGEEWNSDPEVKALHNEHTAAKAKAGNIRSHMDWARILDGDTEKMAEYGYHGPVPTHDEYVAAIDKQFEAQENVGAARQRVHDEVAARPPSKVMISKLPALFQFDTPIVHADGSEHTLPFRDWAEHHFSMHKSLAAGKDLRKSTVADIINHARTSNPDSYQARQNSPLRGEAAKMMTEAQTGTGRYESQDFRDKSKRYTPKVTPDEAHERLRSTFPEVTDKDISDARARKGKFSAWLTHDGKMYNSSPMHYVAAHHAMNDTSIRNAEYMRHTGAIRATLDQDGDWTHEMHKTPTEKQYATIGQNIGGGRGLFEMHHPTSDNKPGTTSYSRAGVDGLRMAATDHYTKKHYGVDRASETSPSLYKSLAEPRLYVDLAKGMHGFAVSPSFKKQWAVDRDPRTLERNKTWVKQYIKHVDGKAILVHEHWYERAKPEGEEPKPKVKRVKGEEAPPKVPREGTVIQSREVEIPGFERQLDPSELPDTSMNKQSNTVHFTLKNQNPQHMGYYIAADGGRGYHNDPDFHAKQEVKKFQRAAFMADNIEAIMNKAAAYQSQPFGTKEHVVGTIVTLIDRYCFRIGNTVSADLRDHYGVTTLEARHIFPQKDGSVRISFTGKSGHDWDIPITGAEAETLTQLKEEATNETDAVWQYAGRKGQPTVIKEDDIRVFLRPWRHPEAGPLEVRGFRTYHANFAMFANLHDVVKSKEFDKADKDYRAKVVAKAFDLTAEKLQHTVGACKKSYVCPELYEGFLETGKLPRASRFAPGIQKSLGRAGRWLPYEQEFVAWMRAQAQDKFTKSLEPALYITLVKGGAATDLLNDIREKNKQRARFSNAPMVTPEEAHQRLTSKFPEVADEDLHRQDTARSMKAWMTHDGKMYKTEQLHSYAASHAMDDPNTQLPNYMRHTGAIRVTKFPSRVGEGPSWAVEMAKHPTTAQTEALSRHVGRDKVSYDMHASDQSANRKSKDDYAVTVGKMHGAAKSYYGSPLEKSATPLTKSMADGMGTKPSMSPGAAHERMLTKYGEAEQSDIDNPDKNLIGYLSRDGKLIGGDSHLDHDQMARHALDHPRANASDYMEHTGAMRLVRQRDFGWSAQANTKPTEAQLGAIGQHVGSERVTYDLYNGDKDTRKDSGYDENAWKSGILHTVGDMRRSVDAHYGADLRKSLADPVQTLKDKYGYKTPNAKGDFTSVFIDKKGNHVGAGDDHQHAACEAMGMSASRGEEAVEKLCRIHGLIRHTSMGATNHYEMHQAPTEAQIGAIHEQSGGNPVGWHMFRGGEVASHHYHDPDDTERTSKHLEGAARRTYGLLKSLSSLAVFEFSSDGTIDVVPGLPLEKSHVKAYTRVVNGKLRS